MKDPAPERQTYLDTTRRTELLDSEARRAEIYAHIGELISVWAQVDKWLEMAGATWANPAGGGKLQGFISQESTSRKIDLLHEVFPADWRDGASLVRHLREANTYRNNLAHLALAMSGADGEQQFGWHFYAFKPKMKRLIIDFDELDAQILRAHVLAQAGLCIMGAPYIVVEVDPLRDESDYSSLNRHSLAEVISSQGGVWRDASHRSSFLTRVGQMFPA